MAVDLHDRDSLFLTSQYNHAVENTILAVDNKPTNQNGSTSLASSDFGSALSSPTESELGSTESESDQDDDYIAELTRQMAHHMLQDDDHERHEKTWSVAGWPQSTAWSELGSSQEEETVVVNKFEKFKIKEEEEIHKYANNEGCLSTSLKTLSVPSTVREPEISPADQFQSKQALIENQIKFYKLKNSEQIMKQQESLNGAKRSNWHKQNDPKRQVKQFQSKGRARGGQFTNHYGQKVSWANLQQQHRTGSEMRAVFLGDSCPRSRSGGGTGVFLPRGIGNTSGSQKKPGCSTVLIPARVVQALKLHFDKMGVASRSNGAILPIQQDASSGDVRCGLQQPPQKKSQTPATPAVNSHQGTGLPQEWPY
ncbi:uncharacterized protein [Populus alba]|uniref:Uncharacterized protein n=2 Tax=Populus TaxID=3689 RepID=A0A4U5QB00_POPAL|nr:uncharacterized protein LOC118058003 isoform X2 [Populus alba]KAJ6984513.1 hypothetical protein NC653_022708 [Populus alba x Populus x berolinensis]TKS06017.1 hypothetical protein D5086_0000127240 [Populus alba]